MGPDNRGRWRTMVGGKEEAARRTPDMSLLGVNKRVASVSSCLPLHTPTQDNILKRLDSHITTSQSL
ncbi:hypothetical protein E2C01_090824 [Portunus trituberculatus]|uniref:Uncharacterized protein n=1 Tax=Portunus trituberculatus TaxID=210409 RepID=A0A5B7JMT1_PORTR|nr:hypothetical protein [Portunus trituberculatus]